MKYYYPLIAMFLLAMSIDTPIRAEDKKPTGNPQMTQNREEMRANRLKNMRKRLDLSDDQQSAIEKILDKADVKREALREEFNQKGKAAMEDTDNQIASVLNAAQKTKFNEMKAEFLKKRQERAEQQPGGPPAKE